MFGDSDGGCWQYRRPTTPIEAKWDDLIVFYKALYRTVTFSEFDNHEKPGYYFYEVDIPANVDARSMSFIPTNFIQSYTVNTRRGMCSLKYFSYIFILSTKKSLIIIYTRCIHE